MTMFSSSLRFFYGILLMLIVTSFTQCTTDETELLPQEINSADSIGSKMQAIVDCSTCTYVVPAGKYLIDGTALNLKPGSVICLDAAIKYNNILFRNINGTPEAPIVIKNCGGTAYVDGTGKSFGIKTELSKYFRITGGDVSKSYGIKVYGGQLGVTLDKLSTNFEVDHLEVHNIGFAGIMAKTDPSCDDATVRGNFTMRDIKIHHNYVHHTGGEGFYVGNSFYENGMNTSCGIRLPHIIENAKIYNNIVRYSGWESIQLGCATVGAEVYANNVQYYATKNVSNQNNGIQIGAGTGGTFYNNFIKDGPGNGLIVMGLGNNIVHNNVIVNAGAHGVFCDERGSTGDGFKFINNTIVNPKKDGIRIYAELLPMNVIVNNIIVNPGSYSSYTNGSNAYVYKLSTAVKIDMSNNYFTQNISELYFLNPAGFNYKLTASSPTINKGRNISSYPILRDYYNAVRLKGSFYDIGASEF